MAKRRKTSKAILPDPFDIVASQAGLTQTIQEFLDSLRSVDASLLNSQLVRDEETTLYWLFANFGIMQVLRVANVAASVPKYGLSTKQRLDIIKDVISAESRFGQLQVDCVDMILLVLNKCPSFSAMSEDMCPAKNTILCPPTSVCYTCSSTLVKHHDCQVRVYSTTGVSKASKVTLRCKKCSLIYNYSQYGNKHNIGFRFYTKERNLVEVTDCLYFDRHLFELQCSLA